jgi:hypothetical protein
MARVAERATFTDFLRDPSRVVEQLARGDVLLRRRSAPDLVLSYASRADEMTSTVSLYARLLVSMLMDDELRPRLLEGDAIPWLRFLPREAREEFLTELADTTAAAAELGVTAPVAQVVHEWQQTAAIYADPELRRELTRPLPGTGTRVPAPDA